MPSSSLSPRTAASHYRENSVQIHQPALSLSVQTNTQPFLCNELGSLHAIFGNLFGPFRGISSGNFKQFQAILVRSSSGKPNGRNRRKGRFANFPGRSLQLVLEPPFLTGFVRYLQAKGGSGVNFGLLPESSRASPSSVWFAGTTPDKWWCSLRMVWGFGGPGFLMTELCPPQHAA